MLKLFRGRKLVGAEIEDFLYLSPGSMAVHDLMIGYELPVHKESGKLVAFKNEILEWQEKHPGIIEIFWQKQDEFLQPREIIQTRKVRLRWGLERIERRQIIL
jgi:hypothetical protein